MNKKTKNIVSVIQTKSAAVLCTLCTVLFLASCADESLVDNPQAQNAFRTVSVDLGMPQDKPAYGDGTDSRAQMADTTATGYRLSFDTAETGKPDASRAGSNDWIDGDRLLLHIVASNADQTTQTTEGMLTLTYSDSKWSLDAMNSYTKYGASFVDYNSAQPKLLITDDDTDIDLANLKMQVDEKIGMSANVTATLVYAPHMKWRLTEGSVTLVVDETASTYEKWEWTNTNSSWTTPYARLRVNTGNGNAGDVVTLTSSAFDSAWEVEPTEGIYTATTDDQGNAYFYGITNGDAALTDNFLVELTQMRVPVPSATTTSEGRSITLEDESTLLIDLDEPITLLEASDVVPVTLTATKAYRIEADVKRTASAKANLSVIDGGGNTEGTADDVATVKAQIETAVAMGITKFTVINQLAEYSKGDAKDAGSVVGEAIQQFGLNNVDTKITLTLADATEVIDCAFYNCTSLMSVSLPEATLIGEYAFSSTALTSVYLPNATSIGECAFNYCTSLMSVSLPAATSIGKYAFSSNTALTNVFLPAAETIGFFAFSSNTALTNVSLPAAEKIGYGAFQNCSALTTVTLPKVEIISTSAFQNCTSLASVVANSATEIWPSVFSGCAVLTSVTFGAVIETIGQNSPGDSPFSNFSTENCDLTLHADQLNHANYPVSASNDKLMWADKAWKSITLLDGPNGTGGTKYYIDNNGVPTVEVDGTCGITGANPAGEDIHVSAMMNKIKVMAEAATANVIVKNGLATYSKGNAICAGSVVGEAILQLLSPAVPSSARAVNGNCKINLVLADATVVPELAFISCEALQSVTAPAVTTIGENAFALCSALTSVSLPEATNIGEQAFALSGLIGVLSLPAAETIGIKAFLNCTALTSVSLPNATTIDDAAFVGTGLTGELSLPAAETIGVAAFQSCTALTTVVADKATTIGTSAFQSCTGLTSVSLPKATTISGTAFQGCAALTTVLFGTAVTSLGNDMVFDGVNTTGCDLTLAVGQQDTGYPVTAENGKLMWAEKQWKSITVGGVQYKAVGNELYAVIDGTDSYLNLSTYVQKGNLKFYVVNGLSGITKAFTIDGTGASEGSISLVLDEGITDIPMYAFQHCNALGSVVANGVETIEYGAFSGTLAIRELTFKKVISCTSNYAFGQQPQDDYYWTFNCTLTLNESQSGVYEGDDIPSVAWGSCFWECIKIGVYVYYMRS